MTEDNSGQRTGGDVWFVEDGREAADGEFTHVMVRLKTAELDIMDTLIAAGIASNRAEAIRWALTRIRERPGDQQLQEHTRDIDRPAQERALTRPFRDGFGWPVWEVRLRQLAARVSG